MPFNLTKHTAGLFLVVSIALSQIATAQHDGGVSDSSGFEEARQFDFWIGEWDVNLRIQQGDLSWPD